MAHRFTVNSTIQGVSIDEFTRIASNTALHEAVCRRIPGKKLEIIENGNVIETIEYSLI